MLVKALLDKPSGKSFGMMPFVAEDDNGSPLLRICGLANNHRKFIKSNELKDLVEGGHALDVSNCDARIAESTAPLTAGWLGKKFEKIAREINAPKPEIPAECYSPDETGLFWIAPARDVYRLLSSWVEKAAPRAFLEDDPRIAELMLWTLPDRIEVQAAFWYTRKTSAEKEKELAWEARLRRDNRRQLSDPAKLKAEFERVARRYLATANRES